jgi:hypothetical protein
MWAVARASAGIALVAGSSLVSLPVGAALCERDIGAAKGYCESLVPRLESYRRTHGSYPTDVRLVGDVAPPPRLLADGTYYTTTGSGFRFSFVNPSGLMDGYEYDSSTGRWGKWD